MFPIRDDHRWPDGDWFFLANLPPDVTETELLKHLKIFGISITPDQINLRHFADGRPATAIIAIPHEQVSGLFLFIFNQRKFRGAALNAVKYAKKPHSNKNSNSENGNGEQKCVNA